MGNLALYILLAPINLRVQNCSCRHLFKSQVYVNSTINVRTLLGLLIMFNYCLVHTGLLSWYTDKRRYYFSESCFSQLLINISLYQAKQLIVLKRNMIVRYILRFLIHKCLEIMKVEMLTKLVTYIFITLQNVLL